MEDVIRKAIERDPRSDYQLAKDCGLAYSVVHRFVNGERPNIGIRAAGALCKQLGLALKPIRKGR